MKTANDVLEMIKSKKVEAEVRFDAYYESSVIPAIVGSGGKKTSFSYDTIHRNIKGLNETQSGDIFYEKMVKLGYIVVKDKIDNRSSWSDHRVLNVSIALA